MSQVQGGRVDLCDHLPSPDEPAAQHQNLIETNALTQSQRYERGRDELIQNNSLNNNGGEDHRGRSREDEEEEDNDEVMKGVEEEAESEESSCLIRCQSPDTPMTDSSYSETGSLLEAPYPLSPGTSPEPISPTIPVASPESAYPSSAVEFSQCDAGMDSNNANTGSPPVSTTGSITCISGPTLTTGPTDSATNLTSDTRHTNTVRPICVTEGTARIAKNTIFTTEPLTSPTELNISSGSTHTEWPSNRYEEPSKVTACSTRLATSLATVPVSSTTQPIISTTGPIPTGTEPTFTTGPVTSNCEHISSTRLPTCLLAPVSATGPIPSPALLASLEQLAQRGDDTHLPQYLHQIAEAFVIHEDYQQALRCLQLERLYHQRILDNLNTLQNQWESQCRRTSSDLETQHLDTLKHICQTHNRPRAKDAVCASLDFLRATFEEERLGGPLPSCTSANQVKGGTEQSSQLVNPPDNVDSLHSLEKTEKNRVDPDQELEGRGTVHGSQLTVKEGSDRGGGELEGGIEYTISVGGNGLHPSTSAEMDQSKPAELQGGEIDPTQGNKVKEEEGEREAEKAAVEMEDEGEEEEEKKEQALPEEALHSEQEVEAQQLHQEALLEELHERTQLYQEAQQPEQGEEGKEEDEDEDEYEYGVEQVDIIGEAAALDDLAKLITVQEAAPAPGLVSILKKRSIHVDNECISASLEPGAHTAPAKRRVRFRVPDDGYEQEVGGGDSCLLLFLLCLVTVVISIGGTALYCALGDAHSSVCHDFSRNADFYMTQVQRGMAQIQYWFTPGS